MEHKPCRILFFCLVSLYLIQCLTDVCQDIVAVLDTYAKAYEIRGNTSFTQLLVAELAMCVTGGMEHAGTSISHMGDDGNHLQRVHEMNSSLAVALQSEGDDTAGTIGQVLLA